MDGRKLKKEVELLDEELRNPVLVKAVDLLYEKPRTAMAMAPSSVPSMSGAQLKVLRSELTDQSKTLFRAGKENAARQLNNVIDGLDDMVQRSLGKEKAGAYKNARNIGPFRVGDGTGQGRVNNPAGVRLTIEPVEGSPSCGLRCNAEDRV